VEEKSERGIGMKNVLITVLTIGLLFSVSSAGEKLELSEQRQRDSYSLGYRFGEDLKKQGMDIDLEVYTTGIWDALEGMEPLMSPEEIRETLAALQKRMFAAQQLQLREKAAKNLEEGKAFLTENAKKEGVKTLPNGLQYKVITEGAGASPKAGDTVTVHYRGTFVDGNEFDSSHKRGKPATFQVDGVIPGWTEALQMMKEGSKWKLFVPPELGYGERGMGSRIPPNSALIFEVELISIDEAPKEE
jgi:FKBP-type peptidyl-prolyl cis-trans isomerase FklB